MEFYLQHGKLGGPYLTEKVNYIKTSVPLSGRTVNGYGSKIPSRYKVLYKNRWYRVYSKCFSNVSCEYIIAGGIKIGVTTY